MTSPLRAPAAVVIPCFNDGSTVGEAVTSVLAQELTVELVVVDDGSTEPATLAALDRLREAGIRVIRQDNQGVSIARMAGVEATSAPFILALDADDRLPPHALARLIAVLERDTSAGVAWGSYRVFGSSTYVQRTAPTLDPWQVSYQNDLLGCAMVRRDALLEAGGWGLGVGHGYEDWDLWMSLAERGWRGVGLRDVVYEYRVFGTGRSAASAVSHEDHYQELRARHPQLFADRRRAWCRSSAPRLLRATLPVIELLPLSRDHKRVLGGVACHVAHRRGLRVLARRLVAVRRLGGRP